MFLPRTHPPPAAQRNARASGVSRCNACASRVAVSSADVARASGGIGGGFIPTITCDFIGGSSNAIRPTHVFYGLGLGTSGLASTWSNCQQTSATSDDGTVSIVRTAAFVDGCVARASGGAHYVGIRAAKVSAPESVDRGANTKTRIGPGKPFQDHHRTVFPCFATARARAWRCWMDAFGAS